MPKNILFNFINHPTTNSVDLFARGVTLVRATNREGQPYFRLDLELEREIIISDAGKNYKLKDHHISIYQEEHRSISELSQYHYTAYFEDNEGSRFQLHVYFDGDDNPATAPAFSRISGSGEQTRVSAEALHESFIDLAFHYSRALIGSARIRLIDTVQELESVYKRLDQEIWEQAEAVTLDKINEILAVLHGLKGLVRHNHYEKSHRFFERACATLRQRMVASAASATLVSDATPAAPPPAAESAASSMADMLPPAALISEPSTSAASVLPEPLEDKLNGLLSRFAALPNFSVVPEERTGFFVNELAQIVTNSYELFLLLEDETTLLAPTLIARLHKLQSDLQKVAEIVIPRLLLGQKFELIDRLPSFHYQITEKFLILALRLGKADLLNYVLTHGDFAINSLPLKADGKIYASAVQYCFAHADKPSMVECLAVLIRNGASILVNDESGLPLAYALLSAGAHPLKAVLYLPGIPEKTITSISFYKQLIASLNRYLSQPGVTEEMRATIEREIGVYQLELDKISNAPEDSSLQQSVTTLAKKYSSKLFIEDIKRDPRCRSMLGIILIHKECLYSKLTPAEKRKFAQQSKLFVEDVDQVLDDLDLDHMTYEEALKYTYAFLEKCIVLVQKVTDLVDVQSELRKKSHIDTVSKRTKQMRNQEEKLLKEINVLQKELWPKSLIEWGKFCDTLDEMIQTLKELREAIATHGFFSEGAASTEVAAAVPPVAPEEHEGALGCG